MNRLLLPLSLFCCALLAGCLTTPVAKSGGPGSVTVTNTNLYAIMNAAQNVFPQHGYKPGPSNFPTSVSYDKPGGAFGKIMWGSYDEKTVIRARMTMTPIPGTHNYVLGVKVSAVTNAGEAGFEDDRKLMGMWSGQFKPLLQNIATQASGAGPM